MSRIGKKPIKIPGGVKIAKEGQLVKVSGPKGNLSFPVRKEITVSTDGTTVTVTRSAESNLVKGLHGLTRTLISNMIKGVTDGFEKKLEIVGVGYKAEVKGAEINFALGFSNPVVYALPQGISAAVDKQTLVSIKGADKKMVGQVAAEIRSLRPPEPYKGKGIKYADEVIRRKAGKAGKAGGK
ncbi:MAG: 50S ribosomal protein L6 [Deltaproteobacteria bacterium]|nr:50S ribosomal protein L6 [Deltaproteobacteria bacterium]